MWNDPFDGFPKNNPKAGIDLYYERKFSMYEAFWLLTTWERYFVIKQESLLLLLYALGLLLARLLFFFVAKADAQVATKTNGTLFGMTPAEANLLIYASLHIVVALVLFAVVLHILLSKRPNPWATKTASFLLGFITHVVVPYPIN